MITHVGNLFGSGGASISTAPHRPFGSGMPYSSIFLRQSHIPAAVCLLYNMPKPPISQLEKIDRTFHKESIFCFTSDIDWAPEWAIKDTLDAFQVHGIPLTPFITHRSAIIDSEYGSNPKQVGLHPNFLPNSSHGSEYVEQIDFVRKLWPRSVSYRSHAFFEDSLISWRFRELGFLYDSNLCLFLQPYCVPLFHQSGLIRFPVFWEDDVHCRTFPMSFGHIRRFVSKPGLKIFNFHPMWISLNVPTVEYYQSRKFLYNRQDLSRNELKKYVFGGRGTKTFLDEVAAYVKASNTTACFLLTLFNDFFS